MRRSWTGGILALLASGCATAAIPPVSPAVATPPAATAAPVVVPEPAVPVPSFYRQALERGTRSADGAPGERYWQNSVSYRIEAELEPSTATIRGSERIVYRNNSPNTLPSILLNLSQNIFTESVPRNRYAPVTGGVTLSRVVAQGETLSQRSPNQIPIAGDPPTGASGYSIQGTLSRVRLPRPLASGDSVVLEIDWEHRVPPSNGFRTAWEDALGSRVFQVAQWYPQVATYDDLKGWDVTPYLGDGEFYLEYGEFDVAITVPAGFLVGATGELRNPEEVLTDEARRRLTAAAGADTITRVVTQADLDADNATQSAVSGQLTWRFTASGVRDFAFATSDGYVWDATRARRSDGSTIMVNSLYRSGAPNWEMAARHGQHATEFFDELLIPYQYPQITISEGAITGMEYPMIVFIYKPNAVDALYAVIAHEIAHEWFPMMVGQDEATWAWMDEGAATYLEALAVGDFFGRENPYAGDLDAYLSVAGADNEVPLMQHTDLVSPYGARVVAAYMKPGILLRSLKHLIGEDTFREALDTYSREWLMKHPTPWDFFSTFERVAGQQLDWFFEPWWFGTGILDFGIASVEGAETGRAVVTVEKIGENPAPAIVMGRTTAGQIISATIPAATWVSGATSATVTLEGSAPLQVIVIDPEQIYPDPVLENNVWDAAGAR